MNSTLITGDEHSRLQADIHRCNQEKGWFDEPVPFIQAMGLLVTEVIEANDAFNEQGGGTWAHKQMASELADCYIRLADDFSRYGLDLASVVDSYRHSFEAGTAVNFDGDCIHLIRHVRNAIEAYRKHGLDRIATGLSTAGPAIARALAFFYLHLEVVCSLYSVDLLGAVDTKMAVNWTRPYRHGGKHA